MSTFISIAPLSVCFIVVILFVLLYYFYWPLCCLFFCTTSIGHCVVRSFVLLLLAIVLSVLLYYFYWPLYCLFFCTTSIGHCVVCSFVLLLLAIVLSVLLYYFYWPLCCPFFFDIRILITPLVSSNSSWLNRPLCYLRILAVYFNLVWRLLQLERLCDHILISYFYSFVLCWKGSMTTH
jgi:hypothetical protein